MKEQFKSQTSITINAPAKRVWKVLIDPKSIKEYMFGASIETSWKPGSPIIYTGVYKGKAYKEKGEIVEFEPYKLLKTTNLSSMSGEADRPENYNTILYSLSDENDKTKLTVTQQNTKSQESVDRSKENWKTVLKSIKKISEDSLL